MLQLYLEILWVLFHINWKQEEWAGGFLASTELSCHWLAVCSLCSLGLRCLSWKKTWKDWKQGAFKDSLRQTLLSSLHFLILSLLWASSMLVETIYSTFPACSLKGPTPSLFLPKLLEGRDPEMLGPHGGKPRFLKRASCPRKPRTITGVRAELYCAKPPKLQGLLVTAAHCNAMLTSVFFQLCCVWGMASIGQRQKEMWTWEGRTRCKPTVSLDGILKDASLKEPVKRQRGLWIILKA